MRKKRLKIAQSANLDFISVKFAMGYPCVRPYILFYISFALFLSYLNITKLLTIKMAAKLSFSV